MTTIRISRLPEIKNDRVSADDYLIINDGDIVTSKVTFEEFVYAIGAQDIEFTGDLLYTGDIVFEGDVTGDFYNKDQTYSKVEIDQIVKNLNDYNVIQDARITALVDMTGRPPMSDDLGIFPGNIIPDNCTIVEAFESIEDYLIKLEARVLQNEVHIIELQQDVEELQDNVTNIFIHLNGLGGGDGNPNPNPDPENPDGILEKVEWLIGQVEVLWEHVTDIETVLGDCVVTNLPGGNVTCALVNHEDRLLTLQQQSAINDAENANLITLSGVGKNGGTAGNPAVPIVSPNLESFTYVLVPHANWNETLASPALDGKSNKEAFQIQLDSIRTRSPIQGPVFTKLNISAGSAAQDYGVTGPVATPSMIPMYHTNINTLNSYRHAADDTTNSCEGSFAYTKTNDGYDSGDKSNANATQGRTYFRNATDWIELLASNNRSAIWKALGIPVAINDVGATAEFRKLGFGDPVDGESGSGYIYVQKNNANDPDEQGYLKVLGVNTASNPRP